MNDIMNVIEEVATKRPSEFRRLLKSAERLTGNNTLHEPTAVQKVTFDEVVRFLKKYGVKTGTFRGYQQGIERACRLVVACAAA